MSASGPGNGPGIESGQARAWGWVEHLRTGGTTSWAEWLAHGVDGVDRGRTLPGAQQLELLRRINVAGLPSTRLIDGVLTASAAGRGRPDFELVGAAPLSRYGPRPVDPADLDQDELLRVAATLLAEYLAEHEIGTPIRRRSWSRKRYRLVGDPWLADHARAELISRGRTPGGRGSTVLVVGRSLDAMLVDAWTASATSRPAADWEAWLNRVRRRGLPNSCDPVAAADAWSRRVGRHRVKIVLDPARLPRAVHVRRLGQPPVLPADALDLSRRVAVALGHLVLPPRRRELLRGLLLPHLYGQGQSLGIPEQHRAWVEAEAARLRARIEAAGYPVLGDPAVITERAVGNGVPSPDGVLAAAIDQLLLFDPDPQED